MKVKEMMDVGKVVPGRENQLVQRQQNEHVLERDVGGNGTILGI